MGHYLLNADYKEHKAFLSFKKHEPAFRNLSDIRFLLGFYNCGGDFGCTYKELHHHFKLNRRTLSLNTIFEKTKRFKAEGYIAEVNKRPRRFIVKMEGINRLSEWQEHWRKTRIKYE